MQLSKEALTLSSECVRIRQALHRIPETGVDLPETRNAILAELSGCGADRVETIAGAGIKAVFTVPGATETIAFRADMDALVARETNRAPYRSVHEDRMHGCGHDGHMAVLLMLARLITERRDRLRQNVVLLFQPGEEGYEGARLLIKAGALRNPDVDRIYGLHLWPTIPKGKIGVRWGYQMAQASDFTITIHGKSAHASSPQMGVDAVVAAAELITMLQTVITRSVDPHQDALLTLGKIDGGVAHNIIADKVTIRGTMRVFSSELFDALSRKMGALMRGLEVATDARFEMVRTAHYPCVSNPREMVEALYTFLDSMDDSILIEPVMAAEDFAEYQQVVPGLFLFLGVGGGKGGKPLHSGDFDFDEDALLYGVELYKRILNL